MSALIRFLVIFVFFSSLSASESIAADKVNFRLDWTIYGTHAPFFLALDKGMYADAGLEVRIEDGQGSGTSVKLVAQGNDDLGFIDFTSTIRGVEQGMPVVALMRILSNSLCIISSASDPVKSPKELEGKIIAYAPSESSAQMFPALLNSQDVDIRKISVVNPAFGAKLALFLQKRADAITGAVTQQIAQIEEQGQEVFAFKYSDFGVRLMNNGIVANKAFVDKNPDVVKRFLKVTRDAFLAAKENPEEALNALIRIRPQEARNRSVLRKQWERSLEVFETINTKGKHFGYMDDRDWQETIKLLMDYGGLPRAVPLGQLYTNAFLPDK
ncbi:MAG: ABC transporter substrate-binding protein [Desulfovibrio sp.]|jgi:NitT/TauT family transport system substrate-binding protein|nr:ABC transporter substrate-binding protein [Desulfovibrio sp.]